MLCEIVGCNLFRMLLYELIKSSFDSQNPNEKHIKQNGLVIKNLMLVKVFIIVYYLQYKVKTEYRNNCSSDHH